MFNSSRLMMVLTLGSVLAALLESRGDEPAAAPVSERARQIHDAGLLIDGHNDLPWELRTSGDSSPDQDRPLDPSNRGAYRHPAPAGRWRQSPVLVRLHPE